MASRAVRAVIALCAVLILLLGVTALAAGLLPGMVWVAVGIGGLLVVVFERVRYRSESAERFGSERSARGGGEAAVPGPPFQRTDEAFLDPTTRQRMRVYVDPRTGERRYHAEP